VRKGLTVALSVIFKTSFASDDFHFTQYRVYVDCNQQQGARSEEKEDCKLTEFGDFS